jgi:hypothetical protein
MTHTRTRLALVLTLLVGSFGPLATSHASAQSDGSSSSDEAPSDADGTPSDAAPVEGAAVEAPPEEAVDETTTTTTTTDGSTTTTDAAALGDGTSTTTTTTTTDPSETTASGEETTEAEADAAQAAREPLAWRNSYFNYSINASFCSFSRDCQLSYNPTVYSFFSLLPRWYLDPATFFSLNQSAYIEHTGDDSATYQSEFQLYDTRIGFNHREAVANGQFLFLPSVTLWLPLSKASQAAQRYFGLTAGLSSTWDPGVAGFNMSLALSYRRWFAGSNVALTHSPFPATTGSGAPSDGSLIASGPISAPVLCNSAESCANQASGSTSEADRITAGLTVNVAPVENLTLTLQIFFIWGNGFGLRDESIATATGNYMVGDGANHWRTYSSYSFYIQYDFAPWLQASLGISNSTQLSPFFSADGSVRSPVNLYDLQGSFGITVTLDSLYESFAAAGEDDGLTPEQRQRRRQGLAHRTSTGGSL